MRVKKKMKNRKKINAEKIAFICYLVAAICFYISAIADFVGHGDSWAVNVCLGSAFLCLSTTHMHKDKGEKCKKD